MNSYILSRQWFDFSFENGSRVKPLHGSIYFWLIELANRLGWPAEFGSPGSQCMAACGISSYNTYKKAFDELVEFGFVEVKRKSVNQYSSCIIALSIFDKAQYKALDKALAMHSIKHLQGTIQSTGESTDSINKPETNKPKTKKLLGAHLFEDSPFVDLELFKQQFTADDFKGIDLDFYFESMRDWSASQGAKKIDWIATARGFIRRDRAENKVKMKNNFNPGGSNPRNLSMAGMI